jgi:ribA/ribD-fused uncharacterized protein
MENKKYTFFWETASPFSQWHPVGFTIDNIFYKTAEHYMMWKKAMLFGDIIKADEVLQTNHPRDTKKKGKEVSGFKKEEWEQHCRSFVYEGNYAKFTQNPSMLKTLMDTGDTLLVEAAPNDKIWGIGLNEKDAKEIPEEEWPGTNWLGLALTELRENLKKTTI